MPISTTSLPYTSIVTPILIVSYSLDGLMYVPLGFIHPCRRTRDNCVQTDMEHNDRAMSQESVAVSPDGRLDLLSIGERRDSRVWGSTALVYRPIEGR